MSLTKEQQIQQLLHNSGRFLILLPPEARGDHVGSAWALAHFLEQQEKPVSVACVAIDSLKKTYDFLVPPKKTLSSLSGLRDFVISFGTKHNRILGVRTESTEDEYRIFVTPEKGSLDPRDFSILPVSFTYDCLIVIGASDKESLGALFEENPDIFYEVPLLNIDIHAENENFGTINLVDFTASAISEVVATILMKLTPHGITEPIAECLLAGITSATESFQKKNTTPKSFQVAADLMERGADQQKIIRYLFKTQPFNLLKLWGRILSGLQWDEPLRLFWSTVTATDLVETRTAATDLPHALEQIRSRSSVGSLYLLFYPESFTTTKVLLTAHHKEALELVRTLWGDLPPLRDDTLEFSLPDTPLAAAETEVIEKLRTLMPKT